MDYDEQEKKAHRIMAVIALVIMVGFLGFQAMKNSQEAAEEPATTVEATATAEVEAE